MFKTLTECRGFWIRRKHWKSIFIHHPDIADELKQQTKQVYFQTIYRDIIRSKSKSIEELKKRNDYTLI